MKRTTRATRGWADGEPPADAASCLPKPCHCGKAAALMEPCPVCRTCCWCPSCRGCAMCRFSAWLDGVPPPAPPEPSEEAAQAMAACWEAVRAEARRLGDRTLLAGVPADPLAEARRLLAARPREAPAPLPD